MKKLELVAVSVLSVVLMGPLPTMAESLGVLAVAESPGPSPELAELTKQLQAAVAERNKGALEASQLRDRMMGQTSTASLSELDRAYAGALATSQNGDFDGAVRTLRAIVDDLEKLPDSSEAFGQWTRAMMRLAREQQTLGRKDEARTILERLVRAAPDVKVDLNQYPPSFEKQVSEIRTQVKAQATLKLTVQAGGKAAKVFVDGREVGTTPVTVNLTRGRHRVSGSLGSLRVNATTVELTEASQTVTLDFALVETLRPNTGPGLALPEADRSKGVVTAGAYLGIDRVVAASLTKQSGVDYLVGSYYDTRRGMLLREGRVRLSNQSAPPGSLTALSAFLLTGQQSDLVATTPAATQPSLAPKPLEVTELAAAAPSKPSKVLGWTAFGTGILTVGLVVFGFVENSASSSKYDEARGLLVPGSNPPVLQNSADRPRYDKLISDGDSAKTMATVGFVGAGVTAVTTGILGYLSYKQCGEVGPFRF